MTAEKVPLRAQISRILKDPRVALWRVAGGTIAGQAVAVLDQVGAELADLEERVTSLERRLAGLGALKVNK